MARRSMTTPGGEYFPLYLDMAQQPHLLIAGATGSGKSVLVNGILHTLLVQKFPWQAQFILIDPKRVELINYKGLPHTLAYASEPEEMIKALKGALNIIEGRYKAMQRKGLKKSEDGDIYIIIDELADLMTVSKRQVQPLLQRICQIGRAANVHVIACTQCPLREVIPTAIKVNFDARAGLRTRSAQDSRNILGFNGCEKLPRYGQGYYMTPEGVTLYNLPMYPEAEINKVLAHWAASRSKRRIKK